MGHRMELYVPAELASSIIDISQSLGVEAKVVGRVEAASEKRVTITSEFGTFTYT